jgi:hypothetical protein
MFFDRCGIKGGRKDTYEIHPTRRLLGLALIESTRNDIKKAP